MEVSNGDHKSEAYGLASGGVMRPAEQALLIRLIRSLSIYNKQRSDTWLEIARFLA
jgi:hypothetical protein